MVACESKWAPGGFIPLAMIVKPRKAKKSSSRSKLPPSPPSLDAAGRIGLTVRYQATSALSSTPITWQCLKKLVYSQTGSTSGATVFLSFRIRRLTMWCAPLIGTSSYTAPTPISCRIREGEGAIATERLVSDVSSGSRGAALTIKFKDTTQDIGKWHDGTYTYTTERAFQLSGPVGTTVDLKFSVQLFVSPSNFQALTASVGTTGGLYWNALDNTAQNGTVGTGYLVPISTVGSVGLAY